VFSVTRRFLVTAPTMVIPLPPTQVLSSQTPVQNWLNWTCPVLITPRHGPHRKQLFHCCIKHLLPNNGRCSVVSRERVYRAVAQNRPWYIRPSRGRCIATAWALLLQQSARHTFCFKLLKVHSRIYYVDSTILNFRVRLESIKKSLLFMYSLPLHVQLTLNVLIFNI
jgi:hypothetical protein